MELAQVNFKLGGNVNNTVILRDVTPAELAIMAYMHGEDCVQSLTLTGHAKDRPNREELLRLQNKFKTPHGAEVLAKVFPGMNPQFPATFRSIGYDVHELAAEDEVTRVAPAGKRETEDLTGRRIQRKIAEGAAARKEEKDRIRGAAKAAGAAPAATAAVHADPIVLTPPDAGLDPIDLAMQDDEEDQDDYSHEDDDGGDDNNGG